MSLVHCRVVRDCVSHVSVSGVGCLVVRFGSSFRRCRRLKRLDRRVSEAWAKAWRSELHLTRRCILCESCGVGWQCSIARRKFDLLFIIVLLLLRNTGLEIVRQGLFSVNFYKQRFREWLEKEIIKKTHGSEEVPCRSWLGTKYPRSKSIRSIRQKPMS